MIVIPELLYNLLTLIALTALSDLINRSFNYIKTSVKIFQGLLFGIATLITMMNPYILTEGLIFDGRSIILSLCALYYGPIAGIISASFALVYRFFIGGDGLLVGELVIFSSTLIGTIFYFFIKEKKTVKYLFLNIYIFGVIVHIVMMAIFLLLPQSLRDKTYDTIFFTVMFFYPIVTLLVGMMIRNQMKYFKLFHDFYLQRENLAITLNSIGDAVISTDLDMKVLNINLVASQLCGVIEKDAIGSPITDILKIFHGREEKVELLLLKEIDIAIANKKNILLIDNYFLLSNQQVYLPIIMNVSPIKDRDEKVVGIVITFSNTSVQDALRSSLSKSEALFKAVFQASANAIVVVDRFGKVVKVNPAFVNTFGYSEDELFSDDFLFSQIFHPDETEIHLNQNLFLNNLDAEVDVRERKIVCKNGSILWVIANAANVNDVYDNNNIKYHVFQLVDITELKQTEKELELRNFKLQNLAQELSVAKEKAETSNNLKSAFLSNMSHEIRTPMNGILGVADLLQDVNINSEDRADYLKVLQLSCNRLLNTFNDVLDASKIESKDIVIHQTEFYIVSLCDHLNGLFEDALNEKKLSFSYTIDQSIDPKWLLIGDYDKVFLILSKLLSNAIKFTDYGSIQLYCSYSKSFFSFEVRDSGIGVSEEFLPYIFTNFTQEDVSMNRGYEGSGLGLAIANGYATALNGSLSVSSKKNVGSIFILNVPLAVASTSEISEQNDSPFILTILVAEDDDISFFLMEQVLTKEFDVNVLRAKNGKVALDVFTKEKNIDLILMDIKMPEMDGFTCIRKIREINDEVPIIAVTAFAFSNDFRRAIEVGANDYISKPYNAHQLIEKIKSFVG